MRAKFRSNIKLNKTANLPSDPQFMIHIANLTEAAIVASKHSWDTLAYFSAEHSVTPEPGYVEDVVKEEQHNVMTATKNVSNDPKYCIVSAPPRILKLETLLKIKRRQRQFLFQK